MQTVKVSHDLFSHASAWRGAIVEAMEEAPYPTYDQDDVSYWQHELAAFDRVFAELQMLKESGQISVD